MQTNKFSEFRTTYEAHTTQIPILKKLTLQVVKSIKTLSPEVQKLPFFLKENVDFNLYALADLNESLIKILEHNSLCSVEALSRVATEQAVSLIYVIDGDSDERAKSLISHYIAVSTKNARHWLEFADSHGLDGSVQSAKQKLQHLLYWEEQFGASQRFKGVEAWPKYVSDRFESIGAMELYHTIFAPSSDSIHGFPEDIFNSTILRYYPDEIRDDAFKSYLAEKRSFAIFLAAHSVGMFIEAMYRLALKIDAKDIAREFESMAETVNSVIATHENDHKKMKSPPRC